MTFAVARAPKARSPAGGVAMFLWLSPASHVRSVL